MELLQLSQMAYRPIEICGSAIKGVTNPFRQRGQYIPQTEDEQKIHRPVILLSPNSQMFILSFKKKSKKGPWPSSFHWDLSTKIDTWFHSSCSDKTMPSGFKDSESSVSQPSCWTHDLEKNQNIPLNCFFTFEELAFASAVFDIYCGYETIMRNSAITYN